MRVLSLKTIALILLLALGVLPAYGQELFSPAPGKRNSNTIHGPEVIQSIPIEINTKVLQENTFKLDLFGKKYSALNQTKDKQQIYLRSGKSSKSYKATITNDEGKNVGKILLSVVTTQGAGNSAPGVASSGVITIQEEDGSTTHYQVQNKELQMMDPSKLNSCSEEVPPPADVVSKARTRKNPIQTRVLNPEEDVVVDVLVLYNPGVTSYLGGHENVEATILLAEAMMNQSLSDANVPASVRIVHYEEMNIGGSSSFATDLNNLRLNAAVANLREEYKADMVSLLRTNGDYCGIGYFLSSIAGMQFYGDALMFTVTSVTCIWYNTFTHELGHNGGLAHDRNNAPPSSGVIDGVAYGNRFYLGNTQYRSIMAYYPGIRVGQYSGPDVLYQGVPTGNESNNNASILRQTMPIISQFRESIIDPGGPNYLVADLGGIPGVHVMLETGPSEGNYTNSRILVTGEDGKVRFDDMVKDEAIRLTAKKGGYAFSSYTGTHRFAASKALTASPQTYSVVIKALDDLNQGVSNVYVYDGFGQYLCKTNSAGICSAGSYRYGETYNIEVGFYAPAELARPKFFPQGNKLTGKVYGPVTRVVAVHER
ncbi:MAG: hypothetical protein KDD55_07885 [Bdellovibrionales bacterium]|nr:hypothetical protein [Bdellovibrionales bacterium]